MAEYDEESGQRYTATTVNLNGAGYLGLGDTAIDRLEDAFGDIDPQIDLERGPVSLCRWRAGAWSRPAQQDRRGRVPDHRG